MELEARRRLAVALLRLGHSVSEVAQVVDVWPSSVYPWRDAYEAGGDAGLTLNPVKGGPSTKLSDEQLTALAALLEEGPQAYGFDTDLWTLKRIVMVIEQEFDVSVGQTTVWRYLQKMGWSCQKPEQRALKRDANAIRRWKQEMIPTLEKKRE
ncbi:IS630 family transposase [Halobellus rarus]|uniref:IS630 family transposase n=1 Tax=Halobellus rarus TaxID=1126237 RepID=A0ABD6CTV6_9EURY|nr:IS630 family transposase [Halobellus rarus]